MIPGDRDSVFSMLRLLEEKNFKETMHKLEKESGLFFNMIYMKELCTNGEWDELENYLSGFTHIDENSSSMTIFFDIRKHKYLEAIQKNDHAKAVKILQEELKVLLTYNHKLFHIVTLLLTLPDFRDDDDDDKLAEYANAESARSSLVLELEKQIRANPVFHDKLQFPTIQNLRSTLIVHPNEPQDSVPESSGYPPMGDPTEIRVTWKLTVINEHSQLRSLKLPDRLLAGKIMRLVYTNSGDAILALTYLAVHKLWKWQSNERNVNGKATTIVQPQFWIPSGGILMTNDVSSIDREAAAAPSACFALSDDDDYVVSASSGRVSLFNMLSFKRVSNCMPPPPVATSLAFCSRGISVYAIGMEDSSIHIHNDQTKEIKVLRGHRKRVSGLAFSNVLGVLVSSEAGGQLCFWSLDGWKKKATTFLLIPPTRHEPNPFEQTCVQFDRDQTNLLVVHETQVAVFMGPELKCFYVWVPQEPLITDAMYSCNSQSVFASFTYGSVYILNAPRLTPRCVINPSSYLSSSLHIFALAIATHPSYPNQFALGLSNGEVHVLEPLETEGMWGTVPPQENDSSTDESDMDQ